MDLDLDFLVPIAVFGFITCMVIAPMIFKNRERTRVHETIRHAIDKGQAPMELMEQLKENMTPRPQRDIRTGCILIAVGAAWAVFATCISKVAGAQEPFFAMIGLSAFPGLIGLVFLAFGALGLNRMKG